MKFSERIEQNKAYDFVQYQGMSLSLSNALWNAIYTHFFNTLESTGYRGYPTDLENLLHHTWNDFLKNPIDEIPSYQTGIVHAQGTIQYLKEWYYERPWFDRYDLIEFFALQSKKYKNNNFVKKCNEVLENEMAGYRLIKHHLVIIGKKGEFEMLNKVLNAAIPIKKVHDALQKAHQFYKEKQFQKCYYESHNALQLIMNEFCQKEKSNPYETLKKLTAASPVFKEVFESLYKQFYLKKENEINHVEALFSLMSCSACIQYIKAKA